MSKSDTKRSHRLLRQAWDKVRRDMTHTTDFVNVLVRVGEIAPAESSFLPPSADWEQELGTLCLQSCQAGEIDCELVSISSCVLIEAESHAAEMSEDRLHIRLDETIDYNPWNSTFGQEDLNDLLEAGGRDVAAESSLEVVFHGKEGDASKPATCSNCIHLTTDDPYFDLIHQHDQDDDYSDLTRIELAMHDLSDGRRVATLSAVSDCEGVPCNAVLKAFLV